MNNLGIMGFRNLSDILIDAIPLAIYEIIVSKNQ